MGGLFVCKSWESLDDKQLELDMGGPSGDWPRKPGDCLTFGKLRCSMAPGGVHDDDMFERNEPILFDSLMLWEIAIIREEEDYSLG